MLRRTKIESFGNTYGSHLNCLVDISEGVHCKTSIYDVLVTIVHRLLRTTSSWSANFQQSPPIALSTLDFSILFLEYFQIQMSNRLAGMTPCLLTGGDGVGRPGPKYCPSKALARIAVEASDYS